LRYLRQREYPQPPPPSSNTTTRMINKVSMSHHLHHCHGRDSPVWFSPCHTKVGPERRLLDFGPLPVTFRF
jgi:hypothetical protein